MPFSDLINPVFPLPSGSPDFSRFDGVGTSISTQGEACGGRSGSASDGGGAEGAPLPCQSSNNSTETRPNLSPYQRKNAYSVKENLEFAILCHGIEKVGFLTLTFPSDLTLKDANGRFNSLATHVLDKMFPGGWMCVREFTKGGRVHFHLIVICAEDIRMGFDFENYLKMARLSSRGRRSANRAEIGRLSRALTDNLVLKGLWGQLRAVLPRYKFGRHELIPIRKCGASVARYVGGYIRKSMEFRPVDLKGARLISYSKSFPRKVVGHAWAWNTDGSWMWRKKVQVFARMHGVKDLDGLSKRFGSRWAWWFRDLIESLNILPHFPMSGSEIVTLFCSIDQDRFGTSVSSPGHSEIDAGSLHLYRPRTPEINGKSIPPPKRLLGVFGFHFANWDKSLEEIEKGARLYRERCKKGRESASLGFFTREMVESAKARILAAPVLSRAAVRAENYRRLAHPVVCES